MSDEATAHPPESVILDIGGDAGSLIIYTPRAMLGSEIEISRDGGDDKRVHVAVWDRPLNGSTVYAAVFPPLAAGPYTVWPPDGGDAVRVTVLPGEVAELRWR